ncbi:hypothetical protein [Actinoplanes sp. NPDC049265]|uniref:hypothetical protein n=1 Tax=Actinoplanes sp. NPDC049265 TaxID=3363902 RepID=UPI003716CD87
MEFGVGYFPTHDAVGPPPQIQVISVPPDPKALERLDAIGVDRALAWLPSGPWSVVEPALENWERAIGELTGS